MCDPESPVQEGACGHTKKSVFKLVCRAVDMAGVRYLSQGWRKVFCPSLLSFDLLLNYLLYLNLLLRLWLNITEEQALQSPKFICDPSHCLSFVLNLTHNFTHLRHVAVAVLLLRKPLWGFCMHQLFSIAVMISDLDVSSSDISRDSQHFLFMKERETVRNCKKQSTVSWRYFFFYHMSIFKDIWMLNNMYHHILYRIECQQSTSGCSGVGK